MAGRDGGACNGGGAATSRDRDEGHPRTTAPNREATGGRGREPATERRSFVPRPDDEGGRGGHDDDGLQVHDGHVHGAGASDEDSTTIRRRDRSDGE